MSTSSPISMPREQTQRVPPLRQGDCLTRAEFERRYEAMQNVTKAELIEGEVYMPSPVRIDEHAGPHFNLIAWLGAYVAATPGLGGGDNASLRLDDSNEPQPDVCVRILPGYGGQTQVSQDGYIEGAPEFLAEVSASTVSLDSGKKMNVYRRHAAQEYLVWRVEEHAIDWHVLRSGQYELLEAENGIFKSAVLPGLWLDSAALIRGDMAAVLAVLQQGIASAEHGAFGARLNQAAQQAGRPL